MFPFASARLRTVLTLLGASSLAHGSLWHRNVDLKGPSDDSSPSTLLPSAAPSFTAPSSAPSATSSNAPSTLPSVYPSEAPLVCTNTNLDRLGTDLGCTNRGQCATADGDVLTAPNAQGSQCVRELVAILEAPEDSISLVDVADGTVVDDDFLNVRALGQARGATTSHSSLFVSFTSDSTFPFSRIHRFDLATGSDEGIVVNLQQQTVSGIVARNDNLYACTASSQVNVYALDDFTLLETISLPGTRCGAMTERDGFVYAVVANPDKVVRFAATPSPSVEDFATNILRFASALAFRKNGNLLVGGEQGTNEFDTDGRLVRNIVFPDTINFGFVTGIFELLNDKFLLGRPGSGDDRGVTIHNRDNLLQNGVSFLPGAPTAFTLVNVPVDTADQS